MELFGGTLFGIFFFTDPHGTAPLVVGRQTVVLVFAQLAFLLVEFRQPFAKGLRIVPRDIRCGMIVCLREPTFGHSWPLLSSMKAS